jgi:hypothetical protein
MYGVPADLDLTVFEGARLTQLRILRRGMTYLEFEDPAPNGQIGIKGALDSAGRRRQEN